ncbi:MAG: helix-turn-helix transcriptional regulator [Polyangiaceae bacterium]|jgi:transcriptional regulator with XRE-family HTH domain|nr:helix-turn-helix transcriptional regulator [Polyangiaceae bacterium]
MSEGFARLLRQHRTRRRWSQEQLGLEAEVSTRHLSCLETGKARPSREMVLLLARVLDLELRERNLLLTHAGFAPVYPSTPLEGVAMEPIHRAIDLLLSQQEPYGAVLLDRCWNVLRVNEGARRLLGAFLDPERVPAALLGNLMRATLHPEGLRPFIENWSEVAPIALERVERAYQMHPDDEERQALRDEIRGYPGVSGFERRLQPGAAPVAVLHLRRGPQELRLFTMLTTLGTPLDVTAQELVIESLFPADDATARWFRDGSGRSC